MIEAVISQCSTVILSNVIVSLPNYAPKDDSTKRRDLPRITTKQIKVLIHIAVAITVKTRTRDVIQCDNM